MILSGCVGQVGSDRRPSCPRLSSPSGLSWVPPGFAQQTGTQGESGARSLLCFRPCPKCFIIFIYLLNLPFCRWDETTGEEKICTHVWLHLTPRRTSLCLSPYPNPPPPTACGSRWEGESFEEVGPRSKSPHRPGAALRSVTSALLIHY